jgi:uncharacterized protein YqfA (UPF0365 family)
MDSQLIYLLVGVAAAGCCWKAGPILGFWSRARRSGAPIRFSTLCWLDFCNIPVDDLVTAYAWAREAGVSIPLSQLADHARAGGDVRAVVYAYVETLQAGGRIDFSRVCEIELEEEA